MKPRAGPGPLPPLRRARRAAEAPGGEAESREEAERLLEGCPIIASVRLYEAMAM